MIYYEYAVHESTFKSATVATVSEAMTALRELYPTALLQYPQAAVIEFLDDAGVVIARIIGTDATPSTPEPADPTRTEGQP